MSSRNFQWCCDTSGHIHHYYWHIHRCLSHEIRVKRQVKLYSFGVGKFCMCRNRLPFHTILLWKRCINNMQWFKNSSTSKFPSCPCCITNEMNAHKSENKPLQTPGLPLHACPSSLRVYPVSQEQVYPGTVLVQCWWHPLIPSVHSSMSANRMHTQAVISCLANLNLIMRNHFLM